MSHANPAGRGWPAGLVGALALVAAFEAMVAAHALDFTTPARLEWRESHKAATERAPGYAVLNLGTSMSKLGLFPAMVERESGRRTFNLSFCAGRIPASYYLLKHALEAGGEARGGPAGGPPHLHRRPLQRRRGVVARRARPGRRPRHGDRGPRPRVLPLDHGGQGAAEHQRPGRGPRGHRRRVQRGLHLQPPGKRAAGAEPRPQRRRLRPPQCRRVRRADLAAPGQHLPDADDVGRPAQRALPPADDRTLQPEQDPGVLDDPAVHPGVANPSANRSATTARTPP